MRAVVARPRRGADQAPRRSRRCAKQASTGASVDNDAAFDAMFGVLGDGGAIGIFPEGLSHDEAHLVAAEDRRRTSRTRRARSARIADHDRAVRAHVHPSETVSQPRARAIRAAARRSPMRVDEHARASPRRHRRDRRCAAPAHRQRARLGHRARARCRAPVVSAAGDLDRGARRAQPPVQHVLRAGRGRSARRHADAARARRIKTASTSSASPIASSRAICRSSRSSARILRHLTLVAFWLPLTVPAAPLHVPPLAFARFASDKLTPRKDVVATTKLLIGLLLVLLGYAIAICVGRRGRSACGTALGLAILLPISGWATLRVLDRLRLVRRGFGVLFRRLAFRREVLALRGEREQLVANVIATVTAVKPAERRCDVPGRSSGSRRRIVEGAPQRRPRFRARQGCRRVKPLVVLLHGLARGRGSMERLGAYLRAHELRDVEPHVSVAQALAVVPRDRADRDASSSAPANARCYAVTHSMGGVVVRHLHDPRLHWQRIVMLAPPNQGSRIAAGLATQSGVPLVLRTRRCRARRCLAVARATGAVRA